MLATVSAKLIQVSFPPRIRDYYEPITSRRGSKHMYWDGTVIFGLVTVGLMIVFMAGWIGFIVRDSKRKK
ncbi:MAG: cytochrome c oxidase subunit CcoM [Pseudomonadota bacterium]